ncbi:MAG: amidohydrolase family protein [Clostridia bacterium]
MKIIDSHRHYSKNEMDIDILEKTANIYEIEKIVMFGHNAIPKHGTDVNVLEVGKKYPNLVCPYLSDLDFTKESADYVKENLNKGFYGIGEVLVGHTGEKKPSFSHLTYASENVINVFKEAAKFNAPVLVHCDDFARAGFMKALEICKETTFIWAHIGYNFEKGEPFTQAEMAEITQLLEKYENLYFDISFWKYSALCMDTPDCLAALEKYNKRFIFGIDMTKDYEQWQYERMPDYEYIFSKLSQKARENILYNNMFSLILKREEKMNV